MPSHLAQDAPILALCAAAALLGITLIALGVVIDPVRKLSQIRIFHGAVRPL